MTSESIESIESIAALEATLLADPDDDATFAVYADALQAAGDPRGMLAAIQRARAADDTPELARAEADLLAANGEHLLGMLGDGRPRPRAHDRHSTATGFEGYELGWAHGHVRSLAIHEPFGVEPLPAAVVSDLLVRPAARFLSRIALEPTEGFAADVKRAAWEQHHQRARQVVAVIAAAARPALRSLAFGRRDIPFDLTGDDHARGAVTQAGEILGELEPVWRAARRLREVLISGGSADLGRLDLPELRRFELRQSYMRRGPLQAVANARVPKLESLVLWLGMGDYGNVGYSHDDLAPLCDPARFPALRHLGLVCSAFTDAVVAMLRRSPILPQLESLDLAGGTLADAELLAGPEFAHLARIDLRWNALAGGMSPANAVVDNQRPGATVPRFNSCQE